MPGLADDPPGLRGLVEGGVVHDEHGASGEFPEELGFQPEVEDPGAGGALEEHRRGQPPPVTGGDERGPGPGLAAALAEDLSAPRRPAVGAVGARLESALVDVG